MKGKRMCGWVDKQVCVCVYVCVCVCVQVFGWMVDGWFSGLVDCEYVSELMTRWEY